MYTKWHPKLKTGFFYVGDQQWYLFADKLAVDMDAVSWYQYDLEEEIETVFEARYGTLQLAPSDVVVEGSTIRLRLAVGNDAHADNFLVRYSVKEVASGRVVQAMRSYLELPITEATRRFFLDPVPPVGRVVIFTDLSINPHRSNLDTHPEFSVDYYTGEVVFHGVDRNLLWNANFNAKTVATYPEPLDWDVYTNARTLQSLYQTAGLADDAIVCGNIVGHDSVFTTLLEAETAYQAGLHVTKNHVIQQVALVQGADTYTLSLNTVKWQDANAVVVDDQRVVAAVAWMNLDGHFLGRGGYVVATTIQGLAEVVREQLTTSTNILPLVGEINCGDTETRSSFLVGKEATDTTTVPSAARRAVVFLTGRGTPLIDSVQFEGGPRLTNFTYAPRVGTFEYEQSDSPYVTVEQLDLNPANEMRVTGILNIGASHNITVDRELY